MEANYFTILWWFLAYIDVNQPWVYMCSPSWTPFYLLPHPTPQGHHSAPALSTLSHASNLDWRSVSHMKIYMFQCHSLKSSYPRLLPQSPKYCSIHLCLFIRPWLKISRVMPTGCCFHPVLIHIFKLKSCMRTKKIFLSSLQMMKSLVSSQIQWIVGRINKATTIY